MRRWPTFNKSSSLSDCDIWYNATIFWSEICAFSNVNRKSHKLAPLVSSLARAIFCATVFVCMRSMKCLHSALDSINDSSNALCFITKGISALSSALISGILFSCSAALSIGQESIPCSLGSLRAACNFSRVQSSLKRDRPLAISRSLATRKATCRIEVEGPCNVPS